MSLYKNGIQPLCSITQTLYLRKFIQSTGVFSRYANINWFTNPLVCGKKTDATNISTLFKPVSVSVKKEEFDVGEEIAGKLDKAALLRVLNKFSQKKEVKLLCVENGMDAYLQQQAYASFRRYCVEAENLPVELHIILSDIIHGATHIDDIFPFFLQHCRTIFPHLDCMDDLKKISDLRTPADWYSEARAISRKIVFHAGPTNSGKTYSAMERFLSAKSGVYCGPLKLLANEVFNKANERGTPCDLVTGEERKFGISEETPASHVACTVEMTSVKNPYEVAIIDEIQMLRDPQRGWAWTRAFLGLIAEEIHVCGELGAFELLKKICYTTGEVVELKTYDRLTELQLEDSALISLDNVMPGDCIVCFSKNDIYHVSREIEARGKEVAVIYGGLPPGTKLAQAAKFNDPNNSCKVMVATDAIGMGLNLSIRRIIFYSLIKPTVNEKGEKEIDTISVSQALQIAGRAGRYGTQFDKGYVTTFKGEDLQTLAKLLQQKPEPLTQAGLHPTADQIELYGYHLPSSTLSNLMDIFVSLSTVDDALYFMCNVDDFKFLADMIQHVPLSLRTRYVFCCAPINRKMSFVCSMFLKIARHRSKNEPITYEFIAKHCGVPLKAPKTILDLVHLEAVFDVMDLYLWLSYRFVDSFPDTILIRNAQAQLDETIQQGVFQITKLLKNTESSRSGGDSTGMSYIIGKKPSFRDAKNLSKGGRLTDRLLAQGLLTPAMLEELKKEWDQQSDLDSDDDSSKKNRRRRKK